MHNYWNEYDTIIIVIPDHESSNIFFNFLKENLPEYYNKMGDNFKVIINHYLDQNREPYARYSVDDDRFKHATTEIIPDLDDRYEKLFYVKDLHKIKNIILGTNVPNYKPKGKRILEKVNEEILHPDYDYETIVIAVRTLDELEEVKPYLIDYDIERIYSGLLDYLENDQECYIRIRINLYNELTTAYSTLKDVDRNSAEGGFKYEKLFSVSDVKKGLLDNIKLDGKANIRPSYTPRKRLLESVKYDMVVVRIENKEELNLLSSLGDLLSDYKSLPFPNWYFIEIENKDAYICPWDDLHSDPKGAMEYINKRTNIYKRIYTIKDLELLKKMKDMGRVIENPSYAPRKKRILEKLNESKFHSSYKYNSILITIKNSDELKRAVNYFNDNDSIEYIEYGVKIRLNDGEECYIRIKENGILNFSALYILEDNVKNNNITYEKLFTMDDIENGVLKDIYKYGKSNPKPTYSSKKRINEGVLNNNYNFGNIVILINNMEELKESEKYLSDLGDWDIVYDGIKRNIDTDPYYIRIFNKHDNTYLSRGTQYFLYSYEFKQTYDIDKHYTIDDLKNGLLSSIMKYGEYRTKPNYKPRKIDRTMENNTFTTEQLLLEKSSLTNLGVPREVMQPIQRDFAIPADATWDRITLKRDVDTLFRKGDKELLLQISIDYIKVFVSQNGKYFVDTYVMKDSGWGGEYEKLERENVSITQLLYQIEPRTLLYNLKSDFSTQKQGKRKLIKKEKEFESFTNKFKEDFLKDFNSILKRIVGSKYKDAKKEIQDKAKQIEMENQMMISGLDDSLAGPNSMTILDNFISEFEEAYSDFFGEYLDIQELSQHFTREKIMTSFMFFIYTGRLLEK